MRRKASIISGLHWWRVKTGDLLMAHASLKAIGRVDGGASGVIEPLRADPGWTRTLMGDTS